MWKAGRDGFLGGAQQLSYDSVASLSKWGVSCDFSMTMYEIIRTWVANKLSGHHFLGQKVKMCKVCLTYSVTYLYTFHVVLDLEPDSVEVESQGGAVGVVVATKVVHQHLVYLLLISHRWALVHHGTVILLPAQRWKPQGVHCICELGYWSCTGTIILFVYFFFSYT